MASRPPDARDFEAMRRRREAELGGQTNPAQRARDDDFAALVARATSDARTGSGGLSRDYTVARVTVAALAGVFGVVMIGTNLLGGAVDADRIVNIVFGVAAVVFAVQAFERKRSSYSWGIGIGVVEIALGLILLATGNPFGLSLAVVAALMLAGVWFSRDTFDRD